MTRLVLTLALGCGTLVGCASEPTGERWAKSHAELSDRLQAAGEIGSNEKRDQALAKIASDAIAKNDAAIALDAVQLIGSDAKRDQKAKEAAIAFHNRKDRASAKRFVELIGSNETRDELNERFAR